MIIESIKQHAKDKGVTLAVLAEKINMTESGMHAMFRNNSMKLSTLEKISAVIGVPIPALYQENQNSFIVKEDGGKYESALEKCHKELNEWKEKAFDLMEKYNRVLEEKEQERNRQTG